MSLVLFNLSLENPLNATPLTRCVKIKRWCPKRFPFAGFLRPERDHLLGLVTQSWLAAPCGGQWRRGCASFAVRVLMTLSDAMVHLSDVEGPFKEFSPPTGQANPFILDSGPG
jgi:hypothetical protein